MGLDQRLADTTRIAHTFYEHFSDLAPVSTPAAHIAVSGGAGPPCSTGWSRGRARTRRPCRSNRASRMGTSPCNDSGAARRWTRRWQG